MLYWASHTGMFTCRQPGCRVNKLLRLKYYAFRTFQFLEYTITVDENGLCNMLCMDQAMAVARTIKLSRRFEASKTKCEEIYMHK